MLEESEKVNPQEPDPLNSEKRKVSHSETGHAINVANFEDLESYCIGFGPAYDPAKASIKLTAIAAKRTASINILKTLDDILPVLTQAVNDREIAFSPLVSLIRRINNAVQASDVSPQFIKDVKTITHKMLGERITPKHPTKEDHPEISEEELIKNYSSSQMGMDSRIENLYKLIQLLAVEPNYNPNEADLKITALTAFHAALKTANSAVINAHTPVANTRIERNVILYHARTGLVKVANDAKKYIKSVFGVSSPQYKLVSKLKFKTGIDLANVVK